ncbi:PREDICTED: squamosa [Prunus dulcis]|nr:squamosa promoter-binding-like protein 6 [Prunus dulcis]KAI5352849.1 hypothetical protein L3X38_005741 [Prunus dulcis]VVA24155.1 PREDICTED: squamosa [Prunus dulcis]
MESWSFGSEGKGFLFPEEIDIQIDAFARSRKALLEWDNKTCLNFGKESVDGMEFMELDLPDIVRKPFHTNQGVEILSGVVGNDSSYNSVASPTCLISSSSSLGEGESGSKFSSPVTESNSQDSSLIALKLGRLTDSKNGQNGQHSKERSKRGGIKGSYSHIPTCQVLGCNMDLSSSKDYHKRHRVCDAHSKTPKVIVNGMEQRFCQQCSRFHLLAEFDDVKRSCRRRLAGHNERRRKPQLDTLNCKPHKLLRSYQGTGYVGTSFAKRTPFVFSDILPGGILYPEEYAHANQYGNVKCEDESTYSQCVTPIANRQMLPKSVLGKQHAPGIPSSGNEYSTFDAASTIQKASGSSNSGCALSLLSTQSHNLSGHSAGVQVPSPSIIQQSTHHSVGQLYEKPSRVNSMEKCGQSGSYLHIMNSMGVDQMESVIDSSQAVDFQLHTDGGFQESHCLSTKYCLSPEHGTAFDLLQLSSHLQRVEHERNFLQVKQEHGEYYCFPTA